MASPTPYRTDPLDPLHAATQICAGWEGGGALVRLAHGSCPVFALGSDLVLKLYQHGDDARREAVVLNWLVDRWPRRAPTVVDCGRFGEWSFVLMERMRGRCLRDAWEDISDEVRLLLLEEAGRLVAELHALDPAGLDELLVDWDAFRSRQVAGCRARQVATGLKGHWLDEIGPFLDRTPLPAGGAPVLLHTELMREHVFVELRDGTWRVTGLLDLEAAMVGPADYDFAAVGIFLTEGEQGAMQAFVRGYGEPPATTARKRRWMGMFLVHRYSDLHWALKRRPPPEEITSLEGLADWWWS